MVKSLKHGTNLSDHHPLCADIILDAPLHASISNQQTRQSTPKVNWDKISPEQLSCFNDFVNNLPCLSPDVISCTDPAHTAHLPVTDSFLISIQQCLARANQSSFTYMYLNFSSMGRNQIIIPGWNDAAQISGKRLV